MDNLLSGALGGIIGTLISSIISYFIFKKQSKIESNRRFLQDLVNNIQNIYISIMKGVIIEEEQINYLISFLVIESKDFQKFNKKLTEVIKELLQYNDGVKKSLQSTSLSTLQISTKKNVENKINELIKILRKLI